MLISIDIDWSILFFRIKMMLVNTEQILELLIYCFNENSSELSM